MDGRCQIFRDDGDSGGVWRYVQNSVRQGTSKDIKWSQILWLNRRWYRLVVYTEINKIELEQPQRFPCPKEQNAQAIVSEDMTETKEMVEDGNNGCKERWWEETERI